MRRFLDLLRLGLAAAISSAYLLSVPAHARAFVVLHKFHGTDGSEPFGPLVADSAGNLYGETLIGGSGAGVVFELSPRGTHWKETVLENFIWADGANPLGGLTIDDDGNLYGTTFSGTSGGNGGVFELSPHSGGKWSFAQIFSFDSSSHGGANPYSGVLRDESGNLYGTTYYGGEHCCGVVFELSPTRDAGWMESVLHSFHDKPDGAYPAAALVRDEAGNLYGTTTRGGKGHCGDGEGDPSGCGTVFAITPSHRGFRETSLHDFQRDEQNMPFAPLTIGPDGAFYGTASYDVFVVRQQGGIWQKQTIYEFREGIAGTITSSGVTFDSAGNLYGTTASSGLNGFSTVYELSPPAHKNGKWTRTTLARFGHGFGGSQPRGGILIGSEGTLYGAADGEPGYIFAIIR